MSTPDTFTIRSFASTMTLAFGITMAAAADTITVCLDGSCDFTDPAAAAAAATSGDVIEIAAGTYMLENHFLIYGPSVEIRGAVDGKGRPATILDGQGDFVTFGAILLPDSTLRVENVVITGGFGEYGGGVVIRHGETTFENCRITGNHANIHGGGMFLHHGGTNVTLSGCEITGNTAAHPVFESLGDGGAIFGGVVTLVDTEVSGNWAQNAGGGFAQNSVVLVGSRICGNDAGLHSPQGYGQVTIITGCIEESCDCLPVSPADLNGDNAVNGADLGLLLANWGQPGLGDLNGDDVVGGADLGLMLAAWSE